MDKLLDKLGIDEKYTTALKKERVFTRVNQQIPLIEHFNYMMDLLFLPTTSQKYKYLLVVVDLANHEFDIEPIKMKTSSSVLDAFKNMCKREYIKMPFASVQTDGGTEFMSVFDQFLKSKKIIHRIAVSGRHSQMANVESLNRQLGRLLNGYMNRIEIKTGKEYNEWTDVIDIIRKELNKIRKVELKDKDINKNMVGFPSIEVLKKDSTYNVGDVVYHMTEFPLSALGHNQSTDKFREGDYRFNLTEPRKIIRVIPDKSVNFRYVLEGLNNVSYTENQLRKADKQKASKYIFEKILDKRKNGRFIEYLIKWKGYKIKDATWQKRTQLIEDGLKSEIANYEKSL